MVARFGALRRSSWVFLVALAMGYGGRVWHRGHEASVARADPAPTPRAPSGELRLCAWNIEKLGHDNGKDYPLVRRIIDENCDAVVLTEVMQKRGAAGGYLELTRTLGEAWTGLITKTPRPNTSSGNSEFYAIVYRKDALELCEGWTELKYVPDGDGSGRELGPDRFVREPAFGCFLLRGALGRFDFLLGAYHAKAHRSASDQGQTEAEAIALGAALTAIKELRPGENDVLIAGDFNLTPPELARLTTLTPLQRGHGSTLNAKGGRSAHLFDGVLVENPAVSPELAASAEVLDVRKYAESARVFARTVSDHLPVRIRLTVRGPDDD